MRSFLQYLEDQGFQSDACESLIEPDFYELAERMHKALEVIHSMGNESDLIDAQMATTMVLYPETYGPEANKAWGLN